jgi:hypothetical protein
MVIPQPQIKDFNLLRNKAFPIVNRVEIASFFTSFLKSQDEVGVPIFAVNDSQGLLGMVEDRHRG